MSKPWNEHCLAKIIAPSNLKIKIEELKKGRQTIATLNGSFDLLHAGHLHIIFEASKQADILLMALNSDHSIQQYKSIHRPIITLKHRLEMVAALGFVDYVTWFEETDPIKLLDLVKPDVHVNGSEYGAECIEASVIHKNGGRVHLVELITGLSTTQVVDKIKTLP